MENYKQKITELMKADNYADAFMYCGKALRENPNDEEVLQTVNFIFQRIQDAHIEIKANTAEEFTMRGIAYFYAGEIEASISDYTKAIELDETFDYAWKSLSFIYFIQDKLIDAEHAILKAIVIKPTGEYYNDYGNIKNQQNPNNPESLDYYLKAVQLNPEAEMYWFNYGCDLAEKGNLIEAIEAFDKAIKLSPHFEDANANRNQLLEHLSRQK